ncbi:MAG: membrane protein insertion efficiency factor YidD [Clostridia bacterium]|nr:membrane protein insertion efficiency factor YidD [Clostridia bacterium]
MRYIAMLLIKFYQKCISPLFPAKCKYHPTCSAYAMTAFRRFGFIRGFLLSGWRILRCNPWSLGGYDPVPEKFTFKVKKYGFCEDCCDEEAEDEKDFKRD